MQVSLGNFDTEAEAALARDLFVIHKFGADAETNFSMSLYVQELQHRNEVWQLPFLVLFLW